MLQGTFQQVRDRFLKVHMDGPPQPVMLRDGRSDESEEAGNPDPLITVSKTNKRKATVEEMDGAKKRMLLPTDSDGIIYKTDGTTVTVDLSLIHI